WELNLDIDDSDLRLTPILHPCSSTRVKTYTTTQKPVRIIPGLAGIVQAAMLLKQTNIQDGGEGCIMSTHEYMKKVVEDVGEDENFKSGSWENFLKNGKVDQVVAIVKSCSPNVTGDLIMILKDLSGTIPDTIHHQVIDEGGYEKDIIIGSALILANVLTFSPKPSMHYLNIIMRNVVKVLCKDTVPEVAVVCGNVTDQEMADEEALNLILEEEARQTRAEHEWLEKCRQEEELKVTDSFRLQDRMKVLFIQKLAEEEAFARFLYDQCVGLTMTNNKNQRLIEELEALGERRDTMRCLDHMREIIARDYAKLGVLEQLLAGTHVGIGLKDSYVDNIEENE
ncbi:hypothetical protein Tco_1097257, partial [Tanacetum coccineum]